MKHNNTNYRSPLSRHACYLVAIVILVVCVSAGEIQAATSWNLEKIHEPRYFRINQRSMVVDASGNPHIFYGGSHLYHSYFDGTQWQRAIIDPAPRTGRAATVAMDSSGHFHVLYEDNYRQVVNYATNVSGSWVIEPLTWLHAMGTVGTPGWYAIAVDPSGHPHIGYYSGTKLMHATKLSIGWQSDMVDDGGYVEGRGDISMAIDGGGHVHVVYHYTTLDQVGYPNSLKHATNASGAWVSEAIDSPTYQPIYYEHSSLALDGNGHAHVVYLGADGSFHYANNVSGSWAIQSIDSSVPSGYYPSIALDSSGKAYVSYMSPVPDPGSEIVSYATNRSGTWVTQTLETSGNWFSAYTTLGIDPSGSVHIAYFDVGTLSIRYLTNSSSNWSATSIDISEEGANPTTFPDFSPVGAFPAIAIDAQGYLHTSYIRSPVDTLNSTSWGMGALMYANNVSGTWTTQVAINGVDVQQNAIAVDAAGHAYVAYFSGTGMNYATNRSGTWVQTTIDPQVYRIMGGTIDGRDVVSRNGIGLVVDNSGYVHVAYIVGQGANNLSGIVRYATNHSGAWQIETVTNISPDSGYSLATDGSVALAIDNNGYAHIGYLDGSGNVTYATNVSGSWTVNIVAPIDRVNRWGDQSMVVEPTGIVHMAFESLYCPTNTGTCFDQGLEYASNVGGVWQREFVDDSVVFTDTSYSRMLFPSLAIDGNGVPYISYWYDEEPQIPYNPPVTQNLRYAYRLGALWRSTNIETDLYVGHQNALTTDTGGNALISYYDEPNGGLKLASSQQVPSPLINVILSPDDPDFGNVAVSSQANRLITLQNIGQISLTISSITLTGNSGSSFTMDFTAGQKPCAVNTNVVLSPGTECTLALLFKPIAAGQVAATFTVSSNDPELPALAGDVMGTGVSSSSSSSGSGGGGGGGCSIIRTTDVDPTLVLVLMLSFMELLRRRSRCTYVSAEGRRRI